MCGGESSGDMVGGKNAFFSPLKIAFLNSFKFSDESATLLFNRTAVAADFRQPFNCCCSAFTWDFVFLRLFFYAFFSLKLRDK